jgi:CheY-like chemotaxis protein
MFFVDIRMPGMSGWDLVAALRDRGVAEPIVMLSANIGDGAGPASSDAGHSDALAKPFDLSQLLDKISAHLALDWTYAEGAAPKQAAKKKLKTPGVEHLRELANLGQIGHIRGIEAKLNELAGNPDNEPLVAALRGHMESFDFDSYAELIERVGHEPD